MYSASFSTFLATGRAPALIRVWPRSSDREFQTQRRACWRGWLCHRFVANVKGPPPPSDIMSLPPIADVTLLWKVASCISNLPMP